MSVNIDKTIYAICNCVRFVTVLVWATYIVVTSIKIKLDLN